MEQGDLLQTKVDLVIRKDGFTFGESDADEEGKYPTSWMIQAYMLPKGSMCTFIRMGEDDESYAVVTQDLIGRALYVKIEHLELISRFSDADSDDLDSYTYSGLGSD